MLYVEGALCTDMTGSTVTELPAIGLTGFGINKPEASVVELLMSRVAVDKFVVVLEAVLLALEVL